MTPYQRGICAAKEGKSLPADASPCFADGYFSVGSYLSRRLSKSISRDSSGLIISKGDLKPFESPESRYKRLSGR